MIFFSSPLPWRKSIALFLLDIRRIGDTEDGSPLSDPFPPPFYLVCRARVPFFSLQDVVENRDPFLPPFPQTLPLLRDLLDHPVLPLGLVELSPLLGRAIFFPFSHII